MPFYSSIKWQRCQIYRYVSLGLLCEHGIAKKNTAWLFRAFFPEAKYILLQPLLRNCKSIFLILARMLAIQNEWPEVKVKLSFCWCPLSLFIFVFARELHAVINWFGSNQSADMWGITMVTFFLFQPIICSNGEWTLGTKQPGKYDLLLLQNQLLTSKDITRQHIYVAQLKKLRSAYWEIYTWRKSWNPLKI